MRLLDQAEIRQIVATGLDSQGLDGRRVLVIIPDRTRTMPMPAMVDLLDTLLTDRVMALDREEIGQDLLAGYAIARFAKADHIRRNRLS